MTLLLALTWGTLPDHQGFGGATTDSISAGDERQHRPSDEPADTAHGIGTVLFAAIRQKYVVKMDGGARLGKRRSGGASKCQP
jgi:hypothetical protein